MNQQAKVLGHELHGLSQPRGSDRARPHHHGARSQHTGHAADAGLSRRTWRYYAIKKYRYPGTPAANDSNRNLLLFRDPSVDGLKTGYTEAAGYCMIATARRDFPNLAPVAGAAAALVAVACCPSCWARPMKTPAPTSRKSCSTGVSPPSKPSSCSRQPGCCDPQCLEGARPTWSNWAGAAHRGGCAGGLRGQGPDAGGPCRAPGGAVDPWSSGGQPQGVCGRPGGGEVPLVALDGVEQAGLLGVPGTAFDCGSSDPDWRTLTCLSVCCGKSLGRLYWKAFPLLGWEILCAVAWVEGFSAFRSGTSGWRRFFSNV
jgi:hypothetical protein